MKKLTLLLLIGLFYSVNNVNAQYGGALNVSGGVGYYQYTHHPVGLIQANYEIGIGRNFTLAPFISYYAYNYDYHWIESDGSDRVYKYHEDVIPVGLKGSYYFDDLLKAGSKWDFYSSLSLGYIFVDHSWEAGYPGNSKAKLHTGAFGGKPPIYLDLHVGSEYRFSKRLGAFIDLSTNVSSIGISIH